MTLRRLLIANRGEIAVRVARGAREMGIAALGIYSEADAGAYFLQAMDESACVGPAPATESYLNIESVIAAAKALRADCVHPGYGFLSERAEFARAVRDAGLVFVGPSPEAMAAMGSKIEAKRRVREHGVPTVPGYDGADQDPRTMRREAEKIGTPLLIKASAGGGGRGMRIVNDLATFDEAFSAAKREAAAAFGDDTVLLEKYLQRPRHIEFQVLADSHGNTIHIGERECSIQRRHQKIIEEAPSVALTPQRRAEMGTAAVRAARSVDYVNAGTCEFVVDKSGEYFFLEMNTRLQVEHPVTELVYGVDLVHWQLRIASGEKLTLRQEDVVPRGWAIEGRVYAEDPANHLLPSTGTIERWQPPEGPGVRVDSGVTTGSDVSVYYDPMLAKLIVWGESREAAIARLTLALESFRVEGIRSNVPLLLWIARDEAFRAGDTTTQFLSERLDESIFTPRAIDAPSALPAAADLLREGRAPWRMAGVGVPLAIAAGTGRFAFNASRNRDGAWVVSGEGMNAGLDTIERNHGVAASFAPAPTVDATAHAGAAASTGRIVAPMPGKIVKIAVKAGDTVAHHALLVVLEAMKMEHRIEAPGAGTISSVAVKEGELVPAGAALLELS
ncbi:MAG: acetyl-CoA carboxylase biotin carboxylase subunit [Candidatus Eremiobacteraeota bacterium]|nr:acetyl-CoA carboxylase biotin carboxylase subunit [Candidatus Eremiobacteraeota bacterium]